MQGGRALRKGEPRHEVWAITSFLLRTMFAMFSSTHWFSSAPRSRSLGVGTYDRRIASTTSVTGLRNSPMLLRVVMYTDDCATATSSCSSTVKKLPSLTDVKYESCLHFSDTKRILSAPASAFPRAPPPPSRARSPPVAESAYHAVCLPCAAHKHVARRQLGGDLQEGAGVEPGDRGLVLGRVLASASRDDDPRTMSGTVSGLATPSPAIFRPRTSCQNAM